MSCITEIIKLKGDQERLIKDGVAVEGGGIYKGLEWIVVFISRGHRCGYVALPADHPLNKINLQSYESNVQLDCHGGITFHRPSEALAGIFLDKFVCADQWIGFDAIHAGDKADYDLVEKLWKDDADLIAATKSIREIHERYPCREDKIRSFDYMKKSCFELIRSVKAYEQTQAA